MRDLWRVTKHPGVTGIGGHYSEGRWHHLGSTVLYTAEHPALALLEAMAHSDLTIDHVPDTLRLCRIQVDASLPAYVPALPNGWQANETMSRKVGMGWLKKGTHALMKVPTAILPHAYNFILNPAHPDIAGKIVEVSDEPVWIDPRFIR